MKANIKIAALALAVAGLAACNHKPAEPVDTCPVVEDTIIVEDTIDSIVEEVAEAITEPVKPVAKKKPAVKKEEPKVTVQVSTDNTVAASRSEEGMRNKASKSFANNNQLSVTEKQNTQQSNGENTISTDVRNKLKR